MKNGNRFRGMMFFLAGLLTASVFQFTFPDQQEVLADDQWCIRQDLDAKMKNGNIPDPEFTILYDVPTCYGNNGYQVERVYMYGNRVAVTYKNPNAVTPSFKGLQGGGFNTIP